MKISVILPDGKEYQLNAPDKDSSESPADLRINGQRMVQEVALLRAPEVQNYGRKQFKTTLTFSCSYKFDTIDDAQEWALMFASGMPDEGTVVIAYGTLLSKYLYLKSAVIQQADVSHKGCSGSASFTIVGGKITKSKP